jgi:hypothetical protein
MDGETSGIVRAPEPMFDAPQQPSARAAYYKNVCTKMHEDDRYDPVEAKITAAEGKIILFEKAIATAIPGGDGVVKARNVAELNTDIEMSYLLPDIYKVGNSDPMNATTHYETIGVSWKSRKGWEWEIIEARNGEISGSFDLFVRPPEGTFAVMWWVNDDPDMAADKWRFADFSHTARGYLDGCTPGKYYYFRAKNSSSVTGKSDWTQVIKVMCK